MGKVAMAIAWGWRRACSSSQKIASSSPSPFASLLLCIRFWLRHVLGGSFALAQQGSAMPRAAPKVSVPVHKMKQPKNILKENDKLIRGLMRVQRNYHKEVTRLFNRHAEVYNFQAVEAAGKRHPCICGGTRAKKKEASVGAQTKPSKLGNPPKPLSSSGLRVALAAGAMRSISCAPASISPPAS